MLAVALIVPQAMWCDKLELVACNIANHSINRFGCACNSFYSGVGLCEQVTRWEWPLNIANRRLHKWIRTPQQNYAKGGGMQRRMSRKRERVVYWTLKGLPHSRVQVQILPLGFQIMIAGRVTAIH